MAKLSSDGKYVTVEKGDTLSKIAQDYAGGASKYKQLAAINNISNPDLIYVGQKIYLTSDTSSSTSGSTSSSSSSSTSSSTQATITAFGLQSNSDNTLFATWTWSKSNTESYAIYWTYDTGDGIWFVGNSSSITVNENNPDASKQSTYSIPSNAITVKFKVKPVSKSYMKNNKETKYWTASWSTEKIYNVSDNPPVTPSVPTIEIDKYKLTTEIANIDANELHATGVQFQIVKNDTSVFKTGKATIDASLNHVTYSCTVDAGGEYKVRCRSYKDSVYSNWSDFTNNVETIPAASSGITTIKANSKTSVYLEWPEVSSATSYDIEYATKKSYFDGSDQTSTVTGIEYTHYEKTGLEAGAEYFFRVRAVNSTGQSAWSDVKSVVIGTKPAAPTTWSSTTTVIVGEPLTLYWIHNSEDGSSQTYGELELIVNNGNATTYTIENSEDEDEKDKVSFYNIDTTRYAEGSTIRWRVRTAGITKVYGDWSVQRNIDIYAPPTLELRVTNLAGDSFDTLDSFPFYIYGLAGPNTQAPIGYQLSITSNDTYETVDNIGNVKIVKKGDRVYSKYFDTNDTLLVEMSASNLDLENNIRYTVTCIVSMNSGLTAESSSEFTVNWIDERHVPNAEISIDKDTLVAYIRPYCEEHSSTYYKVSQNGNTYTVTTETVESIYGTIVKGAKTTTGEQVYYGTTSEDEEIYYCAVETKSLIEDITLSVYRREFDGSFTELATGISNVYTTITDPHPALDYARYRIVAVTNSTGTVGYYDVPGYPVGEKSVIIQWDEDWMSFDVTSEDALEQPVWSGSLLKLSYNIDVSDKHSGDVSLVAYIGRKHPVSYYGTQIGSTSTWSVDIDKKDKDTLYALRRLAIWMGDVYVREPSGSGYWANVSVSFSQTHCQVTIPVTIDVTRVEGGI